MSNASEIASAAADFACGIYKNFPGALVPNPAADVLYSIWDNLCGEPPRDPANLPPPPASAFQGGQCCDAVYRVTTTLYDVQGRPYTTSTNGLGTVLGTFVGNIDNNISYWYVRRQRCNGLIDEYFAGSAENPSRCDIVAITRPDGQPDNCGNPPPKFPSAPPPPPEGYTSPPRPIVFNDNSTNNFTFNFVPPPPPPPNSNYLPPIVITYFNPSANFKIPISFNFNGDINFGGGGDAGYNQDDRDKINNISNTTNNTNNTINNVSSTLNNVSTTTNKTSNELNNYFNITNNQPPNPADYNPPKAPVLPGIHEESYLAAVEITLTTYPKNIRSQEGGSAPDVLYAGWFEFMRGGKALPREPIHFEKGVFVAPSGVDGYAFTLYTGVQGTAVAITKKEKV